MSEKFQFYLGDGEATRLRTLALGWRVSPGGLTNMILQMVMHGDYARLSAMTGKPLPGGRGDSP